MQTPYRYIVVFLATYVLAFLVISIIPAGDEPPVVRPVATFVAKPVEVESLEYFIDDKPTERVKKFRGLFLDREERICKELSALKDHPWAGRYYRGEELDSSDALTVSPDLGAIYELRGCFPTPGELNYGTVSFDGQYLHVNWQIDILDKPWFPTRYLLVPWGERRYLVPLGEILGFCNDINENLQEGTKKFGYHSWHRDDRKKKVSGVPMLPTEFEKYLNMKSINGSIKEVSPPVKASEYGSNKNRISCLNQKVVLDIGEADAVLPQMRFRLAEETGSYGWITITQVRLHEADAIAQFQQRESDFTKFLEVGNRVIVDR